MVSLLTLTNSFVYKFLKKQGNKENKVGVSENLTQEIDITQLINNLTISNEVIKLRTRFLNAIGEGEKIHENGEVEKNNLRNLTFKTNEEKLKDFLLENVGKDGKLPIEKSMMESTGLTEEQLKRVKKDLVDSGFLYKENARVFKMNQKFIRT